ncbi:MAG: cytochrome c oxidase subunit 3 [Saprospiraceae bacterium]|jgi:cytochrome c oxidase subunit 3|nr:cytochrome c oxidase subunit 3 [Candidatus Defluviibacterium haderslevense]
MPVVQMFDKTLPPNRMQAMRFGLWIAMASICMMFGAFTSAYLVRKPVGNWYEFKLPVEFFYSTVLIMVSSIFMELCYKNFKSAHEAKFKSYLIFTTITGIGFVVMQIIAWKTLFAQGLSIDLNVSCSFLYLISGMHALHVLGGLAALIIVFINAFLIPFSANPLRTLKIDLVRQYWHFVDFLWIYLLVFLILQ